MREGAHTTSLYTRGRAGGGSSTATRTRTTIAHAQLLYAPSTLPGAHGSRHPRRHPDTYIHRMGIMAWERMWGACTATYSCILRHISRLACGCAAFFNEDVWKNNTHSTLWTVVWFGLVCLLGAPPRTTATALFQAASRTGALTTRLPLCRRELYPITHITSIKVVLSVYLLCVIIKQKAGPVLLWLGGGGFHGKMQANIDSRTNRS